MFESRWVRHHSLEARAPERGIVAFTSQRRVDFTMVDLAKIIHYPDFWDLAHRFYEESWEYSCGLHYNEILSKHQIAFPLVHSETLFLHPMAYGDTVHCTITVPHIGNTSITWGYEFHNQDGVLCWKSEQVTVCTDMMEIQNKILVPDWMREGLSKLSPDD